MVAKKLLVGLFLCLLGSSAIATTRSPRLSNPEFCNLQQLTTVQPTQRYEFEGGSIEAWESYDEQFQCVGVEPLRATIQPNSLSVPNFHPYPVLIFIEQGEGIVGVHLPGCAETFDTGVEQGQQQQQPRRMQGQGQQQQGQQPRRMQEQGQQQQGQQPRRMQGQGRQQQGGVTQDSHQKLHRFKRGDIIAVPAGAVYWSYNDGNQDVVSIILHDLNNPSNQLDMRPWTFSLAGGISSQHVQGGQRQGQKSQQQQGGRRQGQQQGSYNIDNIFAGFAPEILAEAFNSDLEIVRAMQQSSDRGLIVKVQEPMRFVTPEEEEEQQQRQPQSANGIEEKICSSKIFYNLGNQREADIFSRQAGKLNLVNEHKLPILSYLDLSAEKGHLQQNALLSPHWSVNSHTVVYVLSGDAQVQVVSNNGEAVLNEQVSKGDIFVVPQFFATTAQAGQNGFEWVAFKTNKSPMKSPVAGYTSVFRGMPLEVVTNSYDVSPSQAQSLKTNRETESILFSPQRTASQIS